MVQCGVMSFPSTLYGCRRYPMSTHDNQQQGYPNQVRYSQVISFQYIYIAHLESDFFCRFSNVTLQFSCLGHFAYCVIPLFLRRNHPLPYQLPGEHTCLPSHLRQYLFIIWPCNEALTHTLSHGR